MALRVQAGAEPLAGYRLLDRLGGGGFGEVWSAQGPDGRLVAVKIVYGDLAAAADRRAEQELQSLRRVVPVRHPFLLPIERYEVIEGRLIIVMPLAAGDLAGRLQTYRGQGLSGIPRDELLQHLAQAAEALDALRAAHLQHLDVKPQNLLLMNERVAVADFGLVRDVRGGRPGAGASPAYSAPETFSGRLSPHCDQYSLAVVYQELLTGAFPFTDSSAEHLAHQHLTVPPNLMPLPPADRAAVGRALAKDPAKRFASCTDFVQALRVGWVDERTEEGPPNGTRRSFSALGRSVPRLMLPALIIGVGGVGGMVLRQLRRNLAEQFGPSDRWPVRLLYVDTDPDAIRDAVESGDLESAEVLPTRLHRADHYAKLRLDASTSGPLPWFDTGWLNRLTTRTANGCRGLGRLAFTDHIRALGQKIEADLAAVVRVRAGSPRVVIVSGLAGGTGSGMAMDLAYLCRRLLRRFGDKSAVSSWWLLPPVDADDRAVANAFAALAELRYFAKPDTTYRARCDDPPESLTTRDAPFTEVVVLPLNDTAINAAADGLLRELHTPVQRTAANPDQCRTFGQNRYVWPRRAILRLAARRLAGDLVERWTRTDGTAIRDTMRTWVAGQWSALELGPEALSKRLQQMLESPLGRTVEDAIAKISGPTDFLRPQAAPGVLARLDELLARLDATLHTATGVLVRESGTRLTRLAVTLVEQPDFRLAGAEAALRLLAEQLDRALGHAGPAADERIRKADAARSTADPAEAVRWYPRWKYQALLMCQVNAIYAVFRSHVAEQLNEIGLCRQRLVAVLETLRVEEAARLPVAKFLLPAGCTNIADVALRFSIGVEEVRELDRQVQPHLADMAGGLVRICLTATDLPHALGPVLIELAEAFLEPRLQESGAGDLFLALHSGEEAVSALTTAWAAAAPTFPGSDEVTTMIAPDSLADLARQAFGADVVLVPGIDEVTVVRSAHLPLAALSQLGPAAKATYQRRKAAGDSAHARLDIAAGPTR